MIPKTKHNVVVVLGMHRSGTSALTRGLATLGVALGDNLMPAFEGNNSKGFWEDLEIVAINDALLSALGMEWHTLGGLPREHIDWTAHTHGLLGKRAETYLRQKLQTHTVFGIKDPRLCRLLPFWQEVFRQSGASPFYIISCRHPLSVADSLQARDGIPSGKSHFLWLEHTLLSLQDTQGHPRLVVGFDQLLQEPANQLARIAYAVGLDMPAHDAIQEYSQEFLDSSLRHHVHTAQNIDSSLATAVADTYDFLGALAVSPNQPEDTARTVNALTGALRSLAPLYKLTAEIDAQRAILEKKNGALQHDLHHANLTIQAQSEREDALRKSEQALKQSEMILLQMLAETRNSTSWRITAPLRTLSGGTALLRRKLRSRLAGTARTLYHMLPPSYRAPVIRFAYHYAGALFRNTAHYQRWRLRNDPGQGGAARMAHLAFERDSLADNGTYHLLPGGPEDYCYLPPRHNREVNEHIAGMQRQPLISLITPVYNVDPIYLDALVRSVRAQWYPYWELVLVDDASPSQATRDYLSSLKDDRIRVHFCESNGGISIASNLAIDLARGEYVAFLDHDDELTCDALFELAKAINSCDPDFIYSDEDKIDAHGNYSSPFFKPDWSPDTLMSLMYTCHLGCMRRSLVRELGGLRSEFDGAQDYDLVLRLTERTSRVHHIPRVLYHWRIIPTSIAGGQEAKPFASQAVQQLKEQALRRRGLSGTVESVPEMPGQYRINYHPSGRPLVSIIIPSRDNPDILRQCVDSIFGKTRYPNIELILIDNHSQRPEALAYFQQVSTRDNVQLIHYPHPFNYSAINNLGARHARGEFLLFLNDDTETIHEDWLDRLLGFAQQAHIGAVGAKLLFSNGKLIQHCGVVNLPGGPGHAFYNSPEDIPAAYGRNILDWNWLAVTGACLMVSREKFDAAGGFDENLPIAYNDVDLCWRLDDSGWHNVVCCSAKLIHHESHSRGVDHEDPQKLARLRRERGQLYRKHPRRFMHDPYVNQNLHGGSVYFYTHGY